MSAGEEGREAQRAREKVGLSGEGAVGSSGAARQECVGVFSVQRRGVGARIRVRVALGLDVRSQFGQERGFGQRLGLGWRIGSQTAKSGALTRCYRHEQGWCQ